MFVRECVHVHVRVRVRVCLLVPTTLPLPSKLSSPKMSNKTEGK